MSIIDFQVKQIHKLKVPLITGTPNTEDESVAPEKGLIVYDDIAKEILVGDGVDWFAPGGGGSTGTFVTSVNGATTFNISIYWSKSGNTVTLQWPDLNQPLSTSGQAISTVNALPNELRWIGYSVRFLQWYCRVTNGTQNSSTDGYVVIDFLDGLISWQPIAGNYTGAWAGLKGSSITYRV